MNYKKFSGAVSAALLIVIAIFMVAPGARAETKYKTLHTFHGKDGSSPDANLIFDQAGNLYSTTINGGSGYGTVFELTPNQDGSWAESVLYTFTGGQDGASPFSGLIFDQAGNLYSTTYSGGSAGGGTVFELMRNADGSWTESVLYSFTGRDGSYPVSGVILDAVGSLYGTTTWGGAGGNGTVFKLTPNQDGNWTESVLHSFTGGADGSYPTAHGSLVFDTAGNLYGATAAGGNGNCNVWAPGCGTIFKLIPNSDGTWSEQVLYRFSGGKDGATPYPTLIFDTAGNLYGTTSLGGNLSCKANGYTGCGVVFEMTPNADGSWKETVLHRFTGNDGINPSAGLTIDQAGDLYGMTLFGGNLTYCNGNGCGDVFKLTPNASGGWHGTLLHRFADHPGAYPNAGLTFDAAGNLYGTTYGDGNTTFGSVFEITP